MFNKKRNLRKKINSLYKKMPKKFGLIKPKFTKQKQNYIKENKNGPFYQKVKRGTIHNPDGSKTYYHTEIKSNQEKIKNPEKFNKIISNFKNIFGNFFKDDFSKFNNLKEENPGSVKDVTNSVKKRKHHKSDESK